MDIYALTKLKNAEIIQRFLDEYIIYADNENRETEDFTYYLAEKPQDEETEVHPSISLTNLIEKGLSAKNKGFPIYLRSHLEQFKSVMLVFTYDDKLVLGLSIEDEGAKESTFEEGKKLLEKLMADYNCHLGLIASETPPPLSEAQFQDYLKTQYLDFFVFVNKALRENLRKQYL